MLAASQLLCAPAAGIVSPAKVATCSFSQARKLGAAAQRHQAPAGSDSRAAPRPSAAAPCAAVSSALRNEQIGSLVRFFFEILEFITLYKLQRSFFLRVL